MKPYPLFALPLLLIALLTLTGCYQPVYGQKPLLASPTAQEQKLNQVAITGIPEVDGQKLRNLLIDRFYFSGRPEKPDYALGVRLSVQKEKLGILKDATASRARLTLTASYTLTQNASGKVLFSGNSHSMVAYNIVDPEYATRGAEENATDRGLRELADLITTRVALALNQQDAPTAP